tara:strand:+ start:83 stop:1141 length:1059 start_codon:yes stop_codon:yes gene_type:complete
MSTLLSQGGFGCVYYPGINCSGKSDKDKNTVTKIQKRDFNADNEIYIGKIITSIPSYKKYFIPVITSCPIDVRKLDKKLIGDCKVLNSQNSIDYLLMSLDYVENKSLESTIVLSSSRDIKRKSFAKLLGTYKYLMQGVDLLSRQKIVHFDLKSENLLFSNKRNLPLIIDFGISIPQSQLNTDTMKKYFYVYAPEYYVWPIEVHVICFLLHQTEGNLTIDNITMISTIFTTSNEGLQFFTEDFRRRYLSSCIYQLKQYVGIDRNKVIEALLTKCNTWDGYALSILFFVIFKKIFKGGFHYNKMFIFLAELLVVNISPDPSLRLSPSDSIREYNKCFFIEEDVNAYIQLLDDLV